MNALWTRFRRLVASLMLVAVASFALHSGAMAGLHQHGSGSSECSRQAGAHEHAASSAHVHADGDPHLHAVAGHGHHDTTDDGADGRQAAAETCCANVCAVALTVLAPITISAPTALTAALLPTSQDGASTHLDGLRRPPRPSDIA